MLSFHLVDPQNPHIEAVRSALETLSGLGVAGTSRSAVDTAEALRARKADAFVFPVDRADQIRSIRQSIGGFDSPALIMCADRLSPVFLVRALANGFQGAISPRLEPVQLATQLTEIISGSATLESHPALRGLNISRGLLARELRAEDPEDHDLIDMVGTGLTDEDIAILLDWTVQRVRNRIENLLVTNDLSYRTQLAVIRAANLKVLDIF